VSRASQVAHLARHALARRRLGGSGRRRSLLERELEAVEVVYGALSRAGDAEAVARVLLDEIAELLGVQFVGLSLLEEQSGDGGPREARGLLARLDRTDFQPWQGRRFNLVEEPSGVASAVFETAPVVVYDVADGAGVNRELATEIGAKSAAFVPLVSGGRVIAVLAVATTAEYRSFSPEELGPIRALVAEATLALERARSAAALAEALERERLVAEIGRRVRSELDLDNVQRVAVEETARALGVDRCFIRALEPGGGRSVVAEWCAEGLEPVAGAALLLPVSNLAEELGQTVAIADVAEAAELDRTEASTRRTLLELGSRAVLATPIVVFERTIGVFALHRRTPWEWTDTELALAEAVARELGLAIHTARLLRENELRLGQQNALLRAVQVLAGELHLETVLQLLVDEVAALLRCEVAGCFLYEPGREVLTCAAAYGFDDFPVGLEFPASAGLSGRAIAQGGAVFTNDYEAIAERIPHPAFEDFAGVVAAPMSWAAETRGVLAVASRDRTRLFDETDAELLAGFASVASLALRNAEAFEERERQARVEASFARVASLLGESVSLAETADALAHAVAEALGGAFAVVFLPGGQGLQASGSDRLPTTLSRAFGERLAEGAEVLVEAVRAGRMLTSSDLARDERFADPFRSAAVGGGCRALLAAPVVAPRSDEPGLVVVGFECPRQFADDEVELARQLASAARGALERSELFETERRARALSQQLAAIGSRLGANLEPAAVLRDVAADAPALLAADGCSIQLLEADELVVKAVAGGRSKELLEQPAGGGAGPAAEVLRSRAPVAIADVSTNRRAALGEPFLARGFDAYLGVPLQAADGGLDGVLAVYSRRPRVWRGEEIEALGALALTAAATYSNAELYQRVALERERSVAILGNVADGIVAVDRDGKVVLWNAAAEQITGVPSNEALGRTLAQTLQRELSQEGAPAGEREVTIRRGSDEVRLSLTEAVMRDGVGEVAGRVFAFRDVSTEHVVEQMKTDFVSTVSHELRAPLTSIYGFAATLLRGDIAFSEEERRTFLGYVASEASRLTAIVDQLLNLARLDSGDLEVELTVTDVRAIVADVVAGVETSPTTNDHDFVVELPDEPVAARVDEQKLRQILLNLVDNAVKFSPGDATVRVGARRAGELVEISVADEGPGIPAGERERIFAKFYRLAAPGQSGGTGLGLSLAQGLVAAMGGRITLESAEGTGSTFVVQLPAADAAAARQPEVIA
jgi:PAS domain S-box-containing protein